MKKAEKKDEKKMKKGCAMAKKEPMAKKGK